MSSPIRHLDLFSGIGGFALAARMVGGIETVGFSEIEPYANRVLRKHWPGVPNYGDVRNVHGIECDLITGGFPCQDISRAGKRAGISGSRSGLWHEMLRIIDESRPKWVLAENVARLRRDGLVTVLQTLFEIGYDAQWHCIPAYSVGSPQERDRIWIVAYPMQSGGRPIRRSGCTEETGQKGWAKGTEGDVQLWPEPPVARVAYGIPDGVHRLRGLGNSIVPQVAAEILRCII